MKTKLNIPKVKVGVLIAITIFGIALIGSLSWALTFQVEGLLSSSEGVNISSNFGANVNVGVSVTANHVIDTDSSDGQTTYLYGAWKLTDPDGNVVNKSNPIQLTSQTYSPSTTFKANVTGNWIFDAVIFYAVDTWNETTQSWQVTDSGVDNENTETISVSYPAPNNIAEIISVISNLFNNWL